MEVHSFINNYSVIKPRQIKNVKVDQDFKDQLTIPIENCSLMKKYKKPLTWVDADETIISAYEKLSNQNILSAPVWDSIKCRWGTMLDIKDLVKFVVSLFDENNNLKEGYDYQNVTVRVLLSNPDGSFVKPIQIVKKSDTILTLLKIFHHGNHRVVLQLDPYQPKDIMVISELNLVKWMFRNKDMLGKTGELTLEELGLYTSEKSVISVNINKLSIDAFRILAVNNIYGIPIVNDNGEILDNISVVDIKLTKFDLAKFKQPLSEFFYPNIGSKYPIPLRSPILCTPQTRLREVLGKITSTKVHRIFLSDQVIDSGIQFTPRSVISVSDLVQVLLVLCGINKKMTT